MFGKRSYIQQSNSSIACCKHSGRIDCGRSSPLGDMIGLGGLAVGSIYAMTHGGGRAVSELKDMTMLSDFLQITKSK